MLFTLRDDLFVLLSNLLITNDTVGNLYRLTSLEISPRVISVQRYFTVVFIISVLFDFAIYS